MKLKSIGVASLVTIALAFSACGKKSGERQQNEAKPVAKTVQVDVPATPVQKPTSPASSTENAMSGLWWSDCLEKGAEIEAIRVNVKGDILERSRFTYADMDTCLFDNLAGSDGILDTSNQSFLVRINVVKIDDSVMSHRVEYLQNDGAVAFSFLIRIEEATATKKRKSYFYAPMSFLTSRDAGSYSNDFYKY